jgi:hypothetical protein
MIRHPFGYAKGRLTPRPVHQVLHPVDAALVAATRTRHRRRRRWWRNYH